ncbi:MAG: hypothetical protein RIB84_26340 [Sneathiellaceae bacterium]
MIQADLRTARQHPAYGMNGLILSAIVIAALAALAALAHVLDGLFFMRRTSDAFTRFVSIWDIAMAFLGYLTCAAGLSRHRIFPWLYLAYTIGFILPRAMLELQEFGVNAGMSEMVADTSFLQEIHLLQLLALLLCVSAAYILWSPAVRITYRHRLTRDEVRLIEQMQGAEPRLSLGPRGVEQAAAKPDASRRPTPPVRHDEMVLARRSGRTAAVPEASEQDEEEPLPALPSFFQSDLAAPGGAASAAGGDARRGSGPGSSDSGDPDRDEQAAAALAASTVAGALKRVSGRTRDQQMPAPRPAAPHDAGHDPGAQAAAPGTAAGTAVQAAGAQAAPAAAVAAAPAPAPAPSREAAAAAAGAIVAASQRRTAAPEPGALEPGAPAATGGQPAAPPRQQALAQAQPHPETPAPPPPEPARAERFEQREDPAQRQLEAAAARQKLQEELEIDRRIARLRGLASGQVSALSIGLAMDRNPLAEDADDEGDGLSPGGSALSTTDERLGRLRAAAAPPRNRGDSVRRRDDQALSDELPAVVHNLAAGDPEDRPHATDPIRVGGRLSGAPDLSPRGGGDASFQSRIDALLNRADANQTWQGGSLPEMPGDAPAADPPTTDVPTADAPASADLPPAFDGTPDTGDTENHWPPAPIGAPADWTAPDLPSPAATGLPGVRVAPDLAETRDSDRISAARQPDGPLPAGAPAVPGQGEADFPSPTAATTHSSRRDEEEAPPEPAAETYPPLPKAFAIPGTGWPPEDGEESDRSDGLPSQPAGIPGLAPLPETAESDPAPDASGAALAAAGNMPAPAPVDNDELARSLADILPAVPRPAAGPEPAAVPDGAGAPGRPVDEPPAEPGQGPDPAQGEAQPAAVESVGASAEDGDLAEQRIEAMRILVDEGFLSQAEFERRAAELRAGA